MPFFRGYFDSTRVNLGLRDIIARLNVNWLSPVKVRTMLIGGRDKMLVWNDLEIDEKIKVYDKGVGITNGENLTPLSYVKTSISLRSRSNCLFGAFGDEARS